MVQIIQAVLSCDMKDLQHIDRDARKMCERMESYKDSLYDEFLYYGGFSAGLCFTVNT